MLGCFVGGILESIFTVLKMSSKLCTKCKMDILSDSRVIVCDGCKDELHESCSGLSPTELRCIPLKTRNLLFLCENCRHGFKLMPKLVQQIADLTSKVESLQNDINSMSNEAGAMDSEAFFHEVNDRISRSRNVMFYKIDESSSQDLSERIIQDKSAIRNILSLIEISAEATKVIRVGRVKAGSRRPIKAIFPDSFVVQDILKKKKFLFSKGYSVSADTTQRQRDLYKTVREELQSRKQKGESDITIKYSKGVPRVIKISDAPKK